MSAKLKDLSVVRLKTGQEGTVVSVYDHPGKPLAYMVEVEESDNGLVTVMHDQVEALLWEPKD